MFRVDAGGMVSPWKESRMSKMTELRKSLDAGGLCWVGKGPFKLHLQIHPAAGAFPGKSRQGTQEPGDGTWVPWRSVHVTCGITMFLLASSDAWYTSQSICGLLQDLRSQGGQRKGYASTCKKSTKQ